MKRKLLGVAEFARTFGTTEAVVRWWIFQAEQNGLAKAGGIVRIGRRVYLDEDGFDAWLRAQNPGLRSSSAQQAVTA